MLFWAMLPLCAFVLLVVTENLWPAQRHSNTFEREDWLMNWAGFVMQGAVVPGLGYFVSTQVLPGLLPTGAGVLHIGFVGAFFLNFVVVDFLYYLQHRAFHEVPVLWKLHATHHYSPIVNVWATSRNALVTNLLFVYMLVNPFLGYLCDVPIGFFSAAMLTAALDLVRHANICVDIAFLRGIFVMPQDHHRHHDSTQAAANYGANLLIWDRMFGTCDITQTMPDSYAFPNPPSCAVQLLFPWRA